MIVELIIEDNAPVGWTMKGENPEEIQKLARIRDLQFWGYDQTAIKYNGRRHSNDLLGDPGILHWKQKKYTSQ